MPDKTVYIASDHAGYLLKKELTANLERVGYKVEDLGTDSEASCNYPDFADALCEKVKESKNFGILICGTGIGMSMVANRHKGIRAALCTHVYHALASREHNDANVLCLGARVTAPGLALIMAKMFLRTPFEGGRHAERIALFDDK